VPVVLLPQSLTLPCRYGAADKPGGQGGTKPKNPKSKGKAEPNPEAQPEWSVPTGKKFGNFFSPAKSALKPNCIGWPTFPHHRFQTTGECTTGCSNTHILPSQMNPKTWDEIRVRIKKITGN
jgi:hypothetical protein